MSFHDSLRQTYPHLHKTAAAWTAGGALWGAGRFCVATTPAGENGAFAAQVGAQRDAGSVLFRVTGGPSAGEVLAQAGQAGVPVLLDLSAWKDAVPDPLAAMVGRHFTPVPAWVSQQTALAAAVLVDATHTAHHPFVDSLIQAGKAVFFRRGPADLEPWLTAAEALAAGGVQLLLVVTPEESPLRAPRAALDLLPALVQSLAVPVVFQSASRQAEEVRAQALAAAAAGAHGLVLDTFDPQWTSDLLADLKAQVNLLDKEMPRLTKRAEGLEAQGAVAFADQNRRFRVAFQGERGAYSELAVYSLFPKDRTDLLPCKAFRDVYEAVLRGDADYAALPLENALAGSINDNYDLIIQYPDLHIVGETAIRIEHNLIGLPGTPLSTVKKVLSHPQGLAQSLAFLDSHPEWEKVPFYDTAGSVAHVAKTGDPTLAAIASAEAARVYGMEILQAGVETNHRNFTRFALIAPRQTAAVGQPNKASVVFSTADSPGALSQCLAILAGHNLNMKRLESRPIHGQPWSYMFFVDVEVGEDGRNFRQAVAELEAKAESFRVLGLYRTAGAQA